MNNALNRWELTRTVAVWEFNRFYKIWDEIKGLAFMFLFGLIGFFGATWVFSSGNEVRTIAITENPWYLADSLQTDQYQFQTISLQEVDATREQIESRDLDALIIIHDVSHAELVVRRGQGWTELLKTTFQPLHVQLLQQELTMSDEAFARVRDGIAWTATTTSEKDPSGNISRILAFAAIAFLLMAVFLGFAYQFTAITGEKGTKMTEMMLAIIPPQTWIDGKILGITAIGLVKVVTYSALSILGGIGLLVFTGNDPLTLLGLIKPLDMIVFFSMALLGILMWNAFLAGIASTIDDPNTSERGGLMLMPVLPVLLAAFAVFNPDSTAMRILTFFPLTSSAILPVRMVLTDVMWWEIVGALVFLAITVAAFRRMAGKIFAYSVLIYGKEPSWREMWSVLRQRLTE
jgi:ABC-2 type transport system permease protein